MGVIASAGIYDLPMPLEVGQVFAGYTILRVLGAGGMGSVYLARHPRLPREDALKVLPADPGADPEFRARFLREAELAAALSHPNIVGIHDRGEQESHFWISMDYVAGTDAGRMLEDNYPGGMLLAEVVSIISPVASALDYAHHRGLLHRDAKPPNILLADPDGQARRVYLADFGIARRIDDTTGLTATNMTVGTVSYVAPEQLRGGPVDARADQYALACTAFHMLAGAPPYVDSNPAVVISQHVSAPPPAISAYRPELASLDPVFAAAMAKEPAKRFGSCAEFAAALSRLPGEDFGYPAAIPFPDSGPRIGLLGSSPSTPKRWRRPRVLIPALLAVLLLVAGGVVAALQLARKRHTGGSPTAPPPGTAAAAAPNTGPFTRVYRARFGAGTTLDGKADPAAGPASDTYAVRSVCRPAGCVATAARLTGEMRVASSTVFDQIDDRWFALALGQDNCRGAPDEVWQVFSLQPGPNDTFTGEYRGASKNGWHEKSNLTFTRTNDVDVHSLPDPGSLPPRVVSPAESLRGRYQILRKFSTRIPQQQVDEAVVTDCLRTGDRCMSYFHSQTSDTPLVFSGGNWAMDIGHDETLQGCENLYVKSTAQYPLPQPTPNPIPRLTGQGHHEQTGNCSVSVDFNETLTRIGD